MDRLDFSKGALNAGLTGNKKTDFRKTPKKTESRHSIFNDILEHSVTDRDLGPLPSVTEASDEAKETLLDEVRSAGDSLKRRPLPAEMIEYKKAVRNFLNYVVKNSFDIKVSEGIKRKNYVRGEKRWDAKMHLQIQVIDKKLEELAAEILMKQINDLELKNKLEEITGLLVDITG